MPQQPELQPQPALPPIEKFAHSALISIEKFAQLASTLIQNFAQLHSPQTRPRSSNIHTDHILQPSSSTHKAQDTTLDQAFQLQASLHHHHLFIEPSSATKNKMSDTSAPTTLIAKAPKGSMATKTAKPKAGGAITLTEREIDILVNVWACLKTPPEVSKTIFSFLHHYYQHSALGLSSPLSPSSSWGLVTSQLSARRMPSCQPQDALVVVNAFPIANYCCPS